MKHALSHLLSDFLSALLFLAVYLATGAIVLAAALGIAAALVQLVYFKFRGRHIEPMQWLSLALVIVLGGATMLTQSPRFVMLKPSIAHFAVSAIMLRRGWMLRYLPDIARQNLPASVPVAAGYAWAGLLAGIGVANILLALYADFATWAWFVTVGALGLKIIAFLLQYLVFRTLVRRHLRRTRAAASASVAALG
ncbi:MAG: septation protein IspZ [Alphaproteobacteria bacterium]|nr:septation protein IspZ [Alphaproteobacteria bacterium]MBV9153712.1 septation protein IspZ [Alphaproteobacteria bacterium]MBV9586753.1 septation protein IspZ [Alphaproteobacteria bacterium]MBV9967706.1 septation protein IspZ [Alphaproteobacteria bacterium]